MRKQHYMTEQERHQLEAMRRNKIPVREIARQLGFCERTIYYELKRGSYMHTCEFWDEKRYSAQKGQQKHRYNQTAKGRPLKIGSEFMEYDKLCRSIHGGSRFHVWYCHSYSAWEKGSVENHNRMIRRFFPKGTDFSKISKKRIAAVQDWMNNYPRKILQWQTPNEAAA